MSGFAGLAFGLAGGFLFGPIGFLVGSLIGNLLFPQQQQGPRLSDLKLHNSGYGLMVPIVYGAMRVPGICIWETDLKEHSHSSGGKGGPQITTYTYSASFAEYLSEGEIDFVRTIWADGTLIYDANSTDSNLNVLPCVVYPGNEVQLPDPTIEGVLGVGNTPAYRGKAYVVFDDWDLSAYGNRIPNLNFEVINGTQGPIPWRVSSFDVTVPNNDSWSSAFYDPTGGVLTVSQHYNHSGTGYLYYQESSYLLDGTPTGTSVNAQVAPLDGLSTQGESSGGYSSPYAIGIVDEIDGFHKAWYNKTELVKNLGLTSQISELPTVLGNYIYAVQVGTVGVKRIPVAGGVPAQTFDKNFIFPTLHSGGTPSDTAVRICPGDNGMLYCILGVRGISSLNVVFYEFNPDLTVSRTWQDGQLPSHSLWDSSYNFVIYKGMLCAVDGQTIGSYFRLWRIESPGVTWPLIGQVITTRAGAGLQGIIRFNNGLVATWDGVISLDPELIASGVTLASIVQDQSERAGLLDAQIDVTSLTDIVDGYIVNQQQDCRSNITPLQSAYFFDAVESSGVVKFVKRGGAPVVTIPDNDLAAQAGAGGTPPALVTAKRVQEVDLPAILHVKYINEAAAYQTGDQMSQRQVTSSQLTQTIELSINMTDSKGKQIANTLLFNGWIEREQFTFLTSRKYDYLEPTDVVIAHGYELRIMNKSDVTSGLIQFDGVAALSNLWTQGPTASGGQGNITPVTPTGTQPTYFIPLDIPLVSDTDEAFAFYAAMAGSVDSTWRGANLYISRDVGATYTQDASSGPTTVIGTAQGVLGNWVGGNMFDELNSVSILIGSGGGALSSMSELAVLNGANKALLGSELLQFKNATLTAPSTYLLSGFLRGRRGTEWAIGMHSSVDPFVLMTPNQAPLTTSDYAQPRLYKAVTTSTALASTVPLTFTDTFQTLRCYSPALLGGAVVNSSGDVGITWVRRTRVGGAWSDLTDVPVSEASELYVLQIWDATFSVCARVVTGITAPTFVYTAAMQTTDFGAKQQHIYATVGQIGTFGLGVQAQATVVGAGGSDSAPLNPVTPYNFAPPAPPPAGGCVGNVTTGHFNWASPVRLFSPVNFGPGDVWLIDFTPTGSGQHARINGAEWAATPTNRQGQISAAPCGQPVQPGGTSQGSGVIFYFAWGAGPSAFPSEQPLLAAGTKYYLSVTNDSIVSQMFMDLYVIP